MNIRIILSLTLCLLFSVSATVATSDATTTFGGSKIIAIDQDQRTITFKTKEGQTLDIAGDRSRSLESATHRQE